MEATFILDPSTGQLTVEGLGSEDIAPLASLLGVASEVNCAKPIAGLVELAPVQVGESIKLYRAYTGSVVDGPGRRVVVQMQGCPIRCVGCFVPQTHDEQGGIETTVETIVETVARELPGHDGATILGGEPFAQPQALLALVEYLKMLDIHVAVYTGYRVEGLYARRYQGKDGAAIARVLTLVDLLIDGPFVQKLSQGAGEWRGSTNQRIMTREEIAVLMRDRCAS